MSTVDVKQGRPQSLDSTYSPAPSVRQSVQSSRTPEATGDTIPTRASSSQSSSIKTFGSGGDRNSQHSSQLVVQWADVEDVKQHLENRIQQEGASIRQDVKQQVKQQVDRLEAKIDAKVNHVLENVLPKQFISVDARLDDIEKKFDDNFVDQDKNFRQVSENFEMVEDRFDQLEDKLEEEIKSVRVEMQAMREDIRSIVRMLQMQQGAPTQSPPRIVEHPPSSDSHDAASGDARSRHASDASQRSAAGPSSPRRRQGRSVHASGDEISLSSSKREETSSRLFRSIRRMASRGNDILSKKKKGKGGAQ